MHGYFPHFMYNQADKDDGHRHAYKKHTVLKQFGKDFMYRVSRGKRVVAYTRKIKQGEPEPEPKEDKQKDQDKISTVGAGYIGENGFR